MCALGCPEPGNHIIESAHTYGNTFAALGHVLSDDGRIEPCVSATLRKTWSAFYGNFGRTMRRAPLPLKLKLLDRAVVPCASYRMSRWPFQVHTAKRVDRTQTKMIKILMNLQPHPGEDAESFVRRRNRAASGHAQQQGRWSNIWRKRVLDWSDHLERPRNHSSWASKTFLYRGKDWLQQQRRVHAVGEHSSLLAGRTRTRAFPGIVHKRWHDGVDTAREW